jgi:hypothetical protein
MKFTITIQDPLFRKVYGYKSQGYVFWEGNEGVWYYFNTDRGEAGMASNQDSNYYKNRSEAFRPLYEPFSINIGA